MTTDIRDCAEVIPLKPCPFCGNIKLSEGIECFGHGDYEKTVECSCGAKMVSWEGKAKELWNARSI